MGIAEGRAQIRVAKHDPGRGKRGLRGDDRRDGVARLVDLPVDPNLEQGAWMEAGYKIKMVETPWSTVAVDSPGDIKRVEALMEAK
jgi:hypothetical protein